MIDGYIELHARSAFSFLEGASLPEELIEIAFDLEMPAMGLLDRDGVYGSPRFHMAANKKGIHAHVGSEITAILERGIKPAPEAASRCVTLPLLVQDQTGYKNLCRLITRMKMRAGKHAKPGEIAATLEELEEHAEGLICLTGGEDGPMAHALAAGSPVESGERLLKTADLLKRIFGRDRVYAELQRHLNRSEETRNQAVIEVARRTKLPLLATNGVSYADRQRRELADVLTCVRKKVKLEYAGRLLAMNSERFLKRPSEMSMLFRDLPEAIINTRELSSRLEFLLSDLGYQFPPYPVPANETMDSYLRKLTCEGARGRYTGMDGKPTYDRALQQIEHELALIEKLGLAGYFLIVWDIIRFCREQGILVQGRGSAANSAVCYSLGITAVDPVGMGLLFERFLSEERGEWPDIDLDLPSGDQREKAIQYVYERYGSRGAAMTANVITYRGRSAAREVGKVLGFDEDTVGRLASLVRTWEWKDPLDTPQRQFRDAGLDLTNPRIRKFFELYLSAQDLPRHLGQHSGGMVICQGHLDSVVPLEPASMPGRVVVQWDKEDCADMGIIKVDLLGLGMLAVIEECLVLIPKHYEKEVDLAHIPHDDPEVYVALQKADTIGMFQVESRAQMSCLPRLRPTKFYDIVVQVAIIRPGPIVGNMVHPFLNRRLGREEPVCLHPWLEPVLKRTLGVPLFQEQLLRMAMICANFTGGEAEELRRAMGFKRSELRMQEIEIRLRQGMERNNITGKTQDAIVQSIVSFALYGFPESHAASFALIAYASAYLKCHYPAAFTAAILNNQPMGFYQPATLIKDAQRHGLRVLPIDVTRSDWLCTVELLDEDQEVFEESIKGTNSTPVHAMRLGLKYVKGLHEEAGQSIVRERDKGPFLSAEDLQRRVPEVRKDEMKKLAQVGALNFIGKGKFIPGSSGKSNGQYMHRRDALWKVERLVRPAGPLLSEIDDTSAGSPLTQMSIDERMSADFQGTGVTIDRHPIAYRRQELNELGITPAIELERMKNGRYVRVAGWVIVRQRPGTAKGFMFISLEDETGVANIIVTPQVFERNRAALTNYPFLLIEGALQNLDRAISVKAGRVEVLEFKTPVAISRDFH